MRIDAHQHYWKPDRGDYGWLTPDLKALYRDFLPADLKPHLDRHGIGRTIVVQAAPTVAETEFLLQLCESEETIAGVVGWLDMEADDFAEQFHRLRENPKFVGIRPMLQDLDDDAYILRPKVGRALELLVEHDFPLDLLVFPRHLPHVITLLERWPGLRAVVDHLAKPNIASGDIEPWRERMERVAAHPNVYCKLSGMVTEADHGNWQRSDFVPYVREIVRMFGTGRVMFGSDWPVCLLAASYDEVWDILVRALPETIGEKEKEAIFGSNAARFYRLKL
jgi:L-fuconolactonase